jgi:hypothetical protein
VAKLRGTKKVGHREGMRRTRSAYKVLIGNPER